MTATSIVASERLRISTSAPAIGVDRKAKVIRGFVLAQAGRFKTQDGEFDVDGLQEIVRLGNAEPDGLKSHFTHPPLFGDSLGTFLGRVRNLRMVQVQIERNGERLQVDAVRGDLHFDPSAFQTPNGNLADYLMTLVESDSSALSSSLDLGVKKILRQDSRGRRLSDEKGRPLPPLWFPLRLNAIDLVDEGDAVDGFLGGIDQLSQALQGYLPGETREAIEARLQRALDLRFGNEHIVAPADVNADDLERAMRQRMRGLTL